MVVRSKYDKKHKNTEHKKKGISMEEICEICGKHIKRVDGCVESEVELNNQWYKRLKEPIHEVAPNERCPDCGAEPGHYHHWDCEMEKCPQCGGQLISSTCKANALRAI